MNRFQFPGQAIRTTPQRILLVCTQRIGDVLLATPLARSLKQAWPEAALDMLVFGDTQGALEGNPDISRVIAVPRRATLGEKFAQMRRLWRQYDLALSPIPTDRAHLYCWIAGRRRVGLLSPLARDRLKALLLNQWGLFDDLDTHTVAMGLRLAEMLGVAPCYEVVPPRITPSRDALLARLAPLGDAPLAVLHVYPKFSYKMWPQDAWIALASGLRARGLGLAFTGGAEPAELAYVDGIVRRLPAGALNLAGSLTLGETAALIRRARLVVGPDTAVTHIAAATGTPTIALFGPSNPVKWGPWPKDWNSLESPWQRRGSGRQGNIFLLQGPGDCVPCLLEGCERNVNSGSECLRMLKVETVLQAAEALLSDTQAQASRNV